MGLLDGLIGGVVGGELASLANGLIEKHGGISGMVSELQAKGLGGAVQSWVSNGPNEPVSGDQIQSALGSNTINDLAAKFGISPDLVSSKLAEILPQAVNHLTPNGVVPSNS
jgi:uncharacterized protein YidB (DUF937 family)